MWHRWLRWWICVFLLLLLRTKITNITYDSNTARWILISRLQTALKMLNIEMRCVSKFVAVFLRHWFFEQKREENWTHALHSMLININYSLGLHQSICTLILIYDIKQLRNVSYHLQLENRYYSSWVWKLYFFERKICSKYW